MVDRFPGVWFLLVLPKEILLDLFREVSQLANWRVDTTRDAGGCNASSAIYDFDWVIFVKLLTPFDCMLLSRVLGIVATI